MKSKTKDKASLLDVDTTAWGKELERAIKKQKPFVPSSKSAEERFKEWQERHTKQQPTVPPPSHPPISTPPKVDKTWQILQITYIDMRLKELESMKNSPSRKWASNGVNRVELLTEEERLKKIKNNVLLGWENEHL